MSKTPPELAQAIVDLLSHDPGTAELFNSQRQTESMPLGERTCGGCGRAFLPSAHGRQYCSRECYDSYLEQRRSATGQPKRVRGRRRREVGVLGSGRRFEGEPAE